MIGWCDENPRNYPDIDLSGYTRKADAAKALYAHLRELASAEGQNPDIEVSIRTPAEAEKMGCGRNWQVIWEAGPYQWAIGYSMSGRAANYRAGWFAEPYWGFDLCFTE